MIKCISYWSMPGGLDGACPIDQAFSLTKSAEFQGIELAIAEKGVLTPASDEAACVAIRKSAEKAGLALETLASGMTWGCSPTHPDPAIRRKSIQLHHDALQRAAWLGCKSMLFVPGAVTIPWDASYHYVKYDDAVRWSREAVAELSKTAERVKIELCVENVWNGMFYSPTEFTSFIDSFNSPAVKIYFDVGNVLGYHQHPPHWIELLGKRIARVHIKDFKKEVGTLAGFCDLLEGDVPWKDSIAALRRIGYDKTIVAEMIPFKEGVLEKTSKSMDQILK